METTVTVSARFDAMHQIPAYEPCSDPHGHSWTAEVTAVGMLDPKTGWVHGTNRLAQSLQAIADELDRADLGKMLPGVMTSPLGLASYVLERVALSHTNVASVRVTCSDGTAGEVRRTPRQL